MVTADLAVMGDDLEAVFSAMSGQRLLITGGAGFLGYYMVQAPLAWNAANPDRAPISVTVFDNYFRGVPGWLGELEGVTAWTCATTTCACPSPRTWVISSGSFMPPAWRPPPTTGLIPSRPWTPTSMGCNLLDHAVAQTAAGTPVRGSCSSPRPEIYGDPEAEAIPPPRPIGAMSRAPALRRYDESKRYGETLCVNFASSTGSR